MHRASGEGFEFTMSGIADNLQLHTRPAECLVSPGHLPGQPPSPEAVAACLGESPGAPREYEVKETFNLVAAGDTWTWRESAPMDIPGRGRCPAAGPRPAAARADPARCTGVRLAWPPSSGSSAGSQRTASDTG